MNRDPATRLEGGGGGGEVGELSREIEGQLARWRALVHRVSGRYELDEFETDELMQDVRIRLWRWGDLGAAGDRCSLRLLLLLARPSGEGTTRGAESDPRPWSFRIRQRQARTIPRSSHAWAPFSTFCATR